MQGKFPLHEKNNKLWWELNFCRSRESSLAREVPVASVTTCGKKHVTFDTQSSSAASTASNYCRSNSSSNSSSILTRLTPEPERSFVMFVHGSSESRKPSAATGCVLFWYVLWLRNTEGACHVVWLSKNVTIFVCWIDLWHFGHNLVTFWSNFWSHFGLILVIIWSHLDHNLVIFWLQFVHI